MVPCFQIGVISVLYNEPKRIDLRVVSVEIDGCGYSEDKLYGAFGSLEGELIRGVPFARKKRKRFLRTSEVLEASLDRTEPLCVASSFCGGCSFQHTTSKYQIELKTRYVRECMSSLEPTEWLPPIVSNNYFYRTKARFGVKYVEKKERVLVGFREKLKPYISDIDSCPIMIERVSNVIVPLSRLIEKLSIRRSLPQIEVVSGDDDVALIFRHLEPLTKEDLKILSSFGKEFDLHLFLQSGGVDTTRKIFPKDGIDYFFYDLPEFSIKLRFSIKDFTQVNLNINRLLVSSVVSLLDLQPSDKVLDAFCGIGNFSLAIARFVSCVYGAEYAKSSVRSAEMNASLNKIENAVFQACDLDSDEVCIGGIAEVNKLVLDPPRNGAARFIERMPLEKIERIVYVSCNPVTFGEDLKILLEKGFELKAARVIDMFPHTTHIESLALLVRNNG